MRKLVAVIMGVMLMQVVYAQSIKDADTMLRNTVDSVLKTLKNKDLDKVTRQEKLVEVFDRAFKFDLMAKLSYGRAWQSLSDKRRAQFTKLFIERLKESYMEKLELYSEEVVKFEEPVKKGRYLRIPTFLLSNGDKISMLYKMTKRGGVWYIYDIEIQGVSIISTYRSQYREVLKNGTFQDLLVSMGWKPEQISQ